MRINDPARPTLNLNRVYSKSLHQVARVQLVNGQWLRIDAPEGAALDAGRIAERYNAHLRLLDRVGRKPFHWDIRLAVFLFNEIPPNYRFSRYQIGRSRKFVFWDTSVLKRGADTDPTRAVLCALARVEPHEMSHKVVTIRQKRDDASSDSESWFGEGLAEYLNRLGAPPECASQQQQENPDPLESFSSQKWRELLWRPNPSLSAFPGSRRYGKLSDRERDQLWESINRYYAAGEGAFLFWEREMGRERLFDLIRDLATKHDTLDEGFYADLKRSLGYDPRELTDERIQEVLHSQPAPSAPPAF